MENPSLQLRKKHATRFLKHGDFFVTPHVDLIRRVYEHKNKRVAGFTQKYNVDRLVYYEVCSGIVVAIERKKKQDLINTLNLEWDDLYVPMQGRSLATLGMTCGVTFFVIYYIQ